MLELLDMGYKRTAEHTEKIRQALLGRPRPLWVREKISKTNLGKKKTQEWKEAHSKRMMGRVVSLATREKMRVSQTGRKHTDEAKAKMRLLKGEKSYHWKGDNANYYSFHSWLRKTYGKANKCENKECVYPRYSGRHRLLAPKRFHYSLKKNYKYSHSRENYWMLCASCHGKYDKSVLEGRIRPVLTLKRNYNNSNKV